MSCILIRSIEMAIRVDADTAIGMLSDIGTQLDSEDSLYGNLDSDDSVSSREECDEPENDVSDENEATLNDSSDESSDEEPEDPTATRGRESSSEREREG